MGKKWLGKVHIQEILCLAVLVVLAIAMLTSFTRNSKDELQKLVEHGITQELETYSARIMGEMDRVAGAVTVADRVFVTSIELNNEVIEDMLSVIPTSCESYLAVYCRVDGTAVTSESEILHLGKAEYFPELQGEEPFYTYVENDGVTGNSAVMYVHPVVRNGSKRGYLLAFLPNDFPLSAVQDSEYENRAFFSIMEKNGQQRINFGDTEHTGLLVEDFWGNIANCLSEGQDWQTLEDQIHEGNTGSVYISCNGEDRLICITRLNGTNWLLVMGVEERYVSSLESGVWDYNNRFQLWICGLLLGILVVIIVFNARNRMHSMEESRELENKADTDLLTGLNNKIATERKITEYMKNSRDSQAMMVVLDVDNFKKINDTMGHTFGDEVLRSLGHQLRVLFRSSDILGRLGGDEFIILLKDIKEDAQLEKEGKKLEDFFHQFEVGEYVKYSVTASLGAAVFPRDADTFEGMYKAADAALYMAKRRGKNQLAFYEKRKSEKE